MFVNFLVIGMKIAKLRRDSGQAVLFSRSLFDKEHNNLEYIIQPVYPCSSFRSGFCSEVMQAFLKILFSNRNTKNNSKIQGLPLPGDWRLLLVTLDEKRRSLEKGIFKS